MVNYSILHDLLAAKEGENLEFKERKQRFDFEELVKYACAIANCGGEHIVYGVTDKRLRQVVGTTAIEQPERTRRGLMDRIGLPFDFQLFEEDGKRVVVFIIPPRPVGMPVQNRSKGIFWWRDGDSLISMLEDVMRGIFAEGGHDFSGDVCTAAVPEDLDEAAIAVFRIFRSCNTFSVCRDSGTRCCSKRGTATTYFNSERPYYCNGVSRELLTIQEKVATARCGGFNIAEAPRLELSSPIPSKLRRNIPQEPF